LNPVYTTLATHPPTLRTIILYYVLYYTLSMAAGAFVSTDVYSKVIREHTRAML